MPPRLRRSQLFDFTIRRRSTSALTGSYGTRLRALWDPPQRMTPHVSARRCGRKRRRSVAQMPASRASPRLLTVAANKHALVPQISAEY